MLIIATILRQFFMTYTSFFFFFSREGKPLLGDRLDAKLAALQHVQGLHSGVIQNEMQLFKAL